MTITSRRLVLQGALFGAACACVAARAAYAAETPAASPGGKYVCPPCGCAADGKEFDKPGACPECGMPLVPKPADAPVPPKARDDAGGFVPVAHRKAAEPRKGGWFARTQT
jgi:DNA-directed RNA polymerase subunit RPC12/RpoP